MTDVTLHRLDLDATPTLPAAFRDSVRRAPDRVALRTLGGERSYTWREYAEAVDAAACAAAGNGLRAGDRLGLMTVNGPDFHILDTAALHLGVVPVSLYATLPPEDIAWILGDAGVTTVLAEQVFASQLLAAQRLLPSLERVVVIDADVEGATTWAEWTAAADDDLGLEAIWRGLDPESPATISYTSGTTGHPKGVVLSHRALLGSMDALDRAFGGTIDGARVVSILPFAHVGERMFSHYRSIGYGFEVTSCPDPRLVVQYFLDSRPQYIFSPPRLFDKIRSGLEQKMASDPHGAGGALRAGLDVGAEKVAIEQTGGTVDAALQARWDAVYDQVLLPTLAAFGLDQVESALTGSAMVPPDLVRFFLALGLPIAEGWGMSECAAFGSFNTPGDVRVGTVGRALPGVEIVLADDGEILMRSPWLMTEYLNRPELTAETIDPDGWMHTGDIGELVDGRLRIVDRKKELIISAFGKNMSPANIEAKLKDASPAIGQVVAIGDGRAFNTALITLDTDYLVARFGADYDLAKVVDDPQVRALVDEGVAAANAQLSRVEQVKKYVLLPEEWLPGGDELSPTMKLKRRPINDKYAEQIESLYGAP